MGMKHSFPVPTEQDFQKSVTATTTSASLCASLAPARDVQCTIPQQAWKKGQKETVVDELGIKLVVKEGDDDKNKNDDDTHKCLVYYQDTLVAVLQQPADTKHKPLQICTLAAPRPLAQAVGKYQEQELYEIAIVGKVRDSKQHFLQTTQSQGGSLTWRTDRCGSVSGPQDWIIHQVDENPHVTPPQKKKNNTNKPNLVAHVQELPKRTWGCRVAAGVDPALVVCMIVAADRWRILDELFLRQASGVRSFSGGGSVLKNVT